MQCDEDLNPTPNCQVADMNQQTQVQSTFRNGVRASDGSAINIELANKIAQIRGPEHLASDCSGPSTVIFRECWIWLATASALWVGGLFFILS